MTETPTPAPERRCGLVHDERYFWHQSLIHPAPDVEPGFAFEEPAARRRFLNLLMKTGLREQCVHLPPKALSRTDLLRVHTEDYLDEFAELSAGNGGEVGEWAGFGPGSYEVAALSAGGVYEAVRATLTNQVDVAFALVRPPGHHAEPDRARGYCLLANIPLAIHKARADLGIRRVAVVDWDVHHGNGTQTIFYDDPDVLAISLHQNRLYPEDSGGIDETGTGPGIGTTINVPLPAGSGSGAYTAAFDQIVEPALHAFGPELIVVACGFDASGFDPMGRMILSAATFSDLTQRLLEVAGRLCDGHLVLAQEGGYSAMHVPLCGTAVISTLLGHPQPFIDDYGGLDDLPDQALSETQHTAVQAARQAALDSGAVPRSDTTPG